MIKRIINYPSLKFRSSLDEYDDQVREILAVNTSHEVLPEDGEMHLSAGVPQLATDHCYYKGSVILVSLINVVIAAVSVDSRSISSLQSMHTLSETVTSAVGPLSTYQLTSNMSALGAWLVGFWKTTVALKVSAGSGPLYGMPVSSN